MIEDGIIEVLANGKGTASLETLRRQLSHVAYVSLRYHLARLCGRGLIERFSGESYRLTDAGVRVAEETLTQLKFKP